MSKSSVKKLPINIQNAILDLLGTGKSTDEILQYIHKMGHDHISRSAVGRHTKPLRQSVLEIQKSKAIAKTITENLGSNTDDVGRANIELLQTATIGFLEKMVSSGDDVNVEDIQGMATAIARTARAKKYEIDAITAAREEGAKQALAKAKKDVNNIAKAGGISDEALAKIRNIMQ